MRFNQLNPLTGQVETLEHIPYIVREDADCFEAIRSDGKWKGKVMARPFVSEDHLRKSADSMTRIVK